MRISLLLTVVLASLPACAQSIYTHRFSEAEVSDFFTDGNVAQLADAACSGNRSRVRERVGAGANPNAVGRENMTPLGWALVCRNLSGVRALLDAGADPNQIVFADNYSLKVAISLRNISFLETLLVQGADPNYNYSMAFGAAREAISLNKDTGSWTHFDLLMQYGLNLDLLRVWTQLIQHFAAKRYIMLMKFLRDFSNRVASRLMSFILQKNRSTILRMA